MKNLKPILMLLSFFAVLLLFTNGVSAANWTVNPGDNIQSVINNASENDTVTINDNNGTDYVYNENVVINKKLQLQTNNSGRVTINALDSSKPVLTINSPGNGSSIIGFIITGSTGSHGIYVNTNNCQIIGNTISNNGGYGVNVAGANVTLINNIVFNNGNAGIKINSANVTVKWNNVTFNGLRGFNGWSWDGIDVTGVNATVIENNVTGNGRSGVSVNGANALVFLNYLVQNGGYGIGVTGVNATVINNTVVDNGNAGIVLSSGDNSTISNNTVTNNGYRGFNGWSWDGISVTGNNAVISPDNVIHDNSRNGLYVRGNNICLIGFNVYNNGGYGIDIAGNNVSVISNVLFNNGNAGIKINSANVTVKWNNVTFNGLRGFNGWSWDGIDVTGVNATVIENNVTGNGRSGVSVNGANALVFLNYLVQNGGYGIGVTGVNATVINNTVVDNGNAGIVLSSGDNSTISNNTVTNNGYRGFNGWSWDGIYVRGNNLQILQNSIIRNNWHGINAVGFNLNIFRNNVTSNIKDGINVNGANATITENNVISNIGTGVYLTGAGAVVSKNTAKNNQYGIYFYNSGGMIQSNNLADNQYGIYLSNSNASVNFNRIIGNSKYGLYNTGNGIVNTTNNWWGSNNGPVVSSNFTSDIYVAGGNVTYNNWLILQVTSNPPSTNTNSTITADVTHNNAGEDTSSQGNIPDNIPITFITNIGNISSPAYTRNGKATAIFDHGISTVGLANINATLDNQTISTNVTKPLTITIDQVGGSYNTTKNVTLTLIEPNCNSTIYYTMDGSDPRVNGTIYSSSILINSSTVLRYIAADPAMNWGPEYNQTYVIDNIPPTVTVNIHGGVFNNTQIVNLTVTDNLDQNPVIYYTTNGSDPTIYSPVYNGPITLQMNFTTRTIVNLKFMAVDSFYNQAQIQSETYILTLPVVNTRNNNTYSLIQNAIDANSTIDGDVIELYSGNYVETVIANKKLTIKSVLGNNVTIVAADPNGNVFTVTSNGSGSVIQGLNINGNIILNANNCTIYKNNIIGNGTSGIIAFNSTNSTILYNTITCSGFNGIQSNSSSITIYGNTISGCETGIYSENSNNTIASNILINNSYGIWINNSTDTIHFNRITQNTYGLKNDGGVVNATNNWWGTNYPTANDVWVVSGNVTYNPWLVLNVSPSPTNSGGNASVTADLTHDNNGASTLSQGFIQDGTPVNFNSNFGTILNTAYTIRGQAVTILNLNTTQAQNVTVSASLDNQSVSTTGLISTGLAVLNINSTAIDNATGQTLNTTYTIPLNNSLTWLSVLWINKGLFYEELQIIVDGTVVQNKYFYNAAYTTWNSTYSPSVFAAVAYANKNLPFVSNTTAFWNNLSTNYNLTSTELNFIQNHRTEFIDNLTVNMVYNGGPGLNLTVTDPNNSTDVTNLYFPGSVINRLSQILYIGSPCEGLKSFAIATTCINNTILQYWQNQYSNYQTGDAMNAAYNTFLTALMLEYGHDQIADNITTQYNVNWSRTSPAIVSVGEDVYETYMTLECDHSMGMTVVGTPENIKQFNYVCSSRISALEYEIMNTAYNSTYSYGTFTSVMKNLYYANLNNFTETFIENSYIIIKHEFNDNEFIVVDLETGIVRDVNTVKNFYGGFKVDPFNVYRGPTPLRCVSGGYSRPVLQKGEVINLGTFYFGWDGLGSVYLASSPVADKEADSIWADDTLIINGLKTITKPFADWSGVHPGPAIDITNILIKEDGPFGYYSVQIEVVDVFGAYIGPGPLWIVNDGERNMPDEYEPFTFPIPALTNPPFPWRYQNTPYNPFSYPNSEVPIDINNIGNGLNPEQLRQIEYGVGIGIAIAIALFGSFTGATS